MGVVEQPANARSSIVRIAGQTRFTFIPAAPSLLFLLAAALLALHLLHELAELLFRCLELGIERLLDGEARLDLAHGGRDVFISGDASVDECLTERGCLDAASPLCLVHEGPRH